MPESFPNPTNCSPRKNDTRPARHYSDVLIGVDELYEAAIAGSHPATEKLRQVADMLVRAAGDVRRFLNPSANSAGK